MANKISPLLPSTEEVLKKLGERIRLSRMRRKLTADIVANRAGMSPITLRNVEEGKSGVTIGSYIAVLQVLGLEKDFNLLAQKDELGRELQDSKLFKTMKQVKSRSGKLVSQISKKNDESDSHKIMRDPLSGSWILKTQTANKLSLAEDELERGSVKKSSELVSLFKTRLDFNSKVK